MLSDAAQAALMKKEWYMTQDERCCGTGTCIINEDGYCWCGQRWDGEKMCFPKNGTEPNNTLDRENGAIDAQDQG
ncbi:MULTISPECIES: hypothetical protein [unclassified Limnohabitans]|jgi:hypothetical protein|uniref:hypothetical protein n=1 Tax=unclassified Limnohabitans TaxID=2626134 RepID=UPI000D3D3095|nr:MULTISPECIES: hypothetical protein [unclassified Limnohabitans]